jgi:hypothetical protein
MEAAVQLVRGPAGPRRLSYKEEGACCRASTRTQPAAPAGPLLTCSLQHLLGRVVEDAVHLLGREVELQRRLHAAHAPVLPLSESLPPSCPCPSHWRVAALSHGASHLVADGEKKKLSPGGMAPHTWWPMERRRSLAPAAWRLTLGGGMAPHTPALTTTCGCIAAVTAHTVWRHSQQPAFISRPRYRQPAFISRPTQMTTYVMCTSHILLVITCI